MTYLKLYLLLLKIAALGFGGAYSIWALIEKELVTDCVAARSLLEFCRSDFNAVFAFSEMLPGPQVNAIAMLAFGQTGVGGMLVVVAALVTPGLVLTPVLFRLYRSLKESPRFQDFMQGAVLAILGILILFLWKLGWGLMHAGGIKAGFVGVFAGASFWLSYRYKTNPLLLVLGAAFAGFFLF